MIQVPVQHLEPGMRVAKSVRAGGGVLLLKDGATLTERNIFILRSWGIASIWVEAMEPEPVSGLDPAGQVLQQRVRERFEGVLDHPAMEEIMSVTADLLSWRERKSSQRGR